MYEEHFRLREKPFSMLPDPSYLYWGRRHLLAYSMLEYGVISSSGITVITGDIGCGKTTLIRHLLTQLSDDITVGLLSNTHLAGNELMRWVLMAFDQPFEQSTTVGAFRDFQQFLIDRFAEGKRSLLIVDEAQNLSAVALEELRMLSNINAHKECLLQIVLSGQPQLREILRNPDLKQFAQRVASEFHVEPLEAADVHRYIRHRLDRAGSPVRLFSRKACDVVAEASEGVPRTINLLCDKALVYAYARGLRHVSGHLVEAVVSDKKKFGISTTGARDEPFEPVTSASQEMGSTPYSGAEPRSLTLHRNVKLQLAKGPAKTD